MSSMGLGMGTGGRRGSFEVRKGFERRYVMSERGVRKKESYRDPEITHSGKTGREKGRSVIQTHRQKIDTFKRDNHRPGDDPRPRHPEELRVILAFRLVVHRVVAGKLFWFEEISRFEIRRRSRCLGRAVWSSSPRSHEL